MMQKTLVLGDIRISNDLPLVLVGGLNVFESRDMALEVAETCQGICGKLGIPYIFKASFDKANRSAMDAYRGPGLEQGLEIFRDIKTRLHLPLLTDIHEPWQAKVAAEVVDILQLPAFLSRQTDLVMAMARTGALVNIKKAQFLAPHEMQYILQKFEAAGNENLMLCERGSSFGYNNLIVDMLAFGIMKNFEYPVLFDVTHALQIPGGRPGGADGRRKNIAALARAGVSQKIAGLFLEVHPNPELAKCDGPCALRLDRLEDLLSQVKELDVLIKNQTEIETA
ncbi:MAG: 3-deoxy-8-phosphooctulonate synthase [Pseudomonadales bacterium]|nr:3-deoxy-8-phosphooctulonate synthase [Pseudomonadales bacterium]